uniref:non-specific serine/threonine protein kinase n=1 Tax=Elaeis guineensis var. tenera TaxID=51953 RepID=A0A8N4F3V7_ELAGV|nr:receptor-like protein 32 [Elaeis guineensis]
MDLSWNLPEFPEDSILESLVLSNTNFSGTLPRSIGNLKSLTELQLSGWRLSGVKPSSFNNLTQLVHLDLSSNNLSGKLPSMVRWRSILDVILSNNMLTGSIASSLGNRMLPNLTIIDLTNNSLTGTIPVPLFSLPSLQKLRLRQNQFSGHLEELSNPSSTLSYVDLSNNEPQGPIPKSVFRLSRLKILSLASNNFSGTVGLASIGNLRNLSYLDLSNNMLSIIDGADNSSWVSFPNISILRLVSCNLNRLPGFLRYQNGVSNLDLSMNRIAQVDMEYWEVQFRVLESFF